MPPDLATPRDLKVAMSQKPGPTSSRPPQEPLDEPSPLVSAPPLGLVGGSSNKPTEELDSDKPTMQPPQPPRPPAADANTRPRAPSMKRPKQPKQPNLFIPKNKNNKVPYFNYLALVSDYMATSGRPKTVLQDLQALEEDFDHTSHHTLNY